MKGGDGMAEITTFPKKVVIAAIIALLISGTVGYAFCKTKYVSRMSLVQANFMEQFPEINSTLWVTMHSKR